MNGSIGNRTVYIGTHTNTAVGGSHMNRWLRMDRMTRNGASNSALTYRRLSMTRLTVVLVVLGILTALAGPLGATPAAAATAGPIERTAPAMPADDGGEVDDHADKTEPI